jgi:putative ABC transport system ATP-binding protein/macrolide transport system ATP-binding/permease protein/lipoprotein-releasing system ATP-binding protein
MLLARDLLKIHPGNPGPIRAVSGVSLDVAAGEFVAICGRSGSGKSTLLAMLGGLTEPSGGSVSVAGVDLFALSPDERTRARRDAIGVVFQFAGLLPTLRAIDNVALPAMLAGSVDGVDPYPRAAELLDQVGLADRIDALPHELSGGEQRRVALARALMRRPPLLLCDEPTADLDAATAAEVLALLLDLHRRNETTLIVATHDEEVARQADRVLYLDCGRVASVAASASRGLAPPRLPSPIALAREPRAAPHPPTERLGAGFAQLLARSVLALMLGAVAVTALERATRLYQRHRQHLRAEARQLLEETALQRLRADVDRLVKGPDGSYSVALSLQNLDPESPIFVSAPAVRAFVQVDRDWVEVPARSSDEKTDGVLSLSGKRAFHFTVEPELARFTELIPGYMHVRFSNAMLVGRDRNGASGLFERTDDYYVYLKPHGADDGAICRRNKWVTAPLWIAMPPH